MLIIKNDKIFLSNQTLGLDIRPYCVICGVNLLPSRNTNYFLGKFENNKNLCKKCLNKRLNLWN